MAGKVDKLEYDLLRCIFNGTAITNVCSSGGSTSTWLGLMTADPAEAGSTAAEGGCEIDVIRGGDDRIRSLKVRYV